MQTKTIVDLKNRNVYIFGAGKRGKLCQGKLNQRDIKICGFIDNDVNKTSQKENIYSYEEYLKHKKP